MTDAQPNDGTTFIVEWSDGTFDGEIHFDTMTQATTYINEHNDFKSWRIYKKTLELVSQ